MANLLFEQVLKEEHPMFDCAVITKQHGLEYWKNPLANNANNGHSTTKLIVATGIGILRDRGVISLSDKVNSFFSPRELPWDYDGNWNKVTVRDTLRHRMGIGDIESCVDYDELSSRCGDDFLKFVFSLKIEHEPGTYRQYSDEAYYLLCRIIHKASGLKADEFLKDNLFTPLHFRQWATAKCPQGHPIGGGGFFARSDDLAKLGYTYAMGGVFEGRRIISNEWIDEAMANDYALSEFRDTGIFVKTGANGQMIAFSKEKESAVSWHGYSTKGNERNDRLLEAYDRYLKAL